MANKTSIKSTKAARKAAAKRSAKPTLLAGGNPQIAKADGDAPVQAYIAAMPGWKRDVGRRLDALIARTVPGVAKAVKWNSPFYGVEGPGEENGWFLSFHCFTKYIKVAFFRGASLRPVPPGESKQKDSALPRHPRGRPARRSPARRLGEASEPYCRANECERPCVGRIRRRVTPSANPPYALTVGAHVVMVGLVPTKSIAISKFGKLHRLNCPLSRPARILAEQPMCHAP